MKISCSYHSFRWRTVKVLRCGVPTQLADVRQCYTAGLIVPYRTGLHEGILERRLHYCAILIPGLKESHISFRLSEGIDRSSRSNVNVLTHPDEIDCWVRATPSFCMSHPACYSHHPSPSVLVHRSSFVDQSNSSHHLQCSDTSPYVWNQKQSHNVTCLFTSVTIGFP